VPVMAEAMTGDRWCDVIVALQAVVTSRRP
jgi:hypothetical protein